MSRIRFLFHLLLCSAAPTFAADPGAATITLPSVVVTADPGASASTYAGGQVAGDGNLGLLGDRSIFDTPFSTTNFTAEYIQNQQPRTVGDILLSELHKFTGITSVAFNLILGFTGAYWNLTHVIGDWTRPETLGLAITQRLYHEPMALDALIANASTRIPGFLTLHQASAEQAIPKLCPLRNWLKSHIEVVASDETARPLETLPLQLSDAGNLETYCQRIMAEFHENRAYDSASINLAFRYKQAA